MNKYSEMQKDKPIIFDTCIFMVGIEKRLSDSNYSLENMRKNWMDDVLSHFENILLHEVVYNVELDSETKNQGEVHSLTYACYHNISLFSSKDSDACDVCNEIEELNKIEIVGFETILGIAYKNNPNKDKKKALKALYKEFCAPRIRQGVIPKTLGEFMGEDS